MDVPSALRDELFDINRCACDTAHRLRAEAEKAESTALFWTKLTDYLAKGWVLHFRDAIVRQSKSTGIPLRGSDSHGDILERAIEATEEESTRILRRFPDLIEKAFRESNVVMDSTSRHPKYTFEQGFLKLEIDDKKAMARLSNHESKLTELPADIQALVEVVQDEHRRIFGRSFDGQLFLKTLRQQYSAILKKENMSDGSSLPIRKITHRMGKNVKGFRTDEFLIDLSKLSTEGPLIINGRRLDLQQTKDTSQGMLLYGAAGRGYIGFVIFREAEHG